jgi:hypothetical protein
MTTIQTTYNELLNAADCCGITEPLESYLCQHTGRDSAEHLVSFYTGEWLGAIFTLDNGVTLDTYHGNLTMSHADTFEVLWIEDPLLETMLDEVFRNIYESGDIAGDDIVELH